jgi:hypothetical protein
MESISTREGGRGPKGGLLRVEKNLVFGCFAFALVIARVFAFDLPSEQTPLPSEPSDTNDFCLRGHVYGIVP